MTSRFEPTRAWRTGLVATVGALVLSACAWGYPADPGRRPRGGSAPAAYVDETVAAWGAAAADPAAEGIYRRRCGQCHEPFDPGYAGAAEWPMFVARYGPRAGLFGAERARVLAWLQASAGR